VKNIAGIGTEQPPQVRQAHAAETNSPAVARKPAEFIGGRSGIPAAGDIFKTADLKDDPVRVGKGVLVGSLHRNPFSRPGDGLAALAADDIFLFLRGSLCGLLLSGCNFAFIIRFVGRHPKAINIVVYRYMHLLSYQGFGFIKKLARVELFAIG
jgi:hypothetical protein